MKMDDVFHSAPHAPGGSARASVHLVSDFVDIAIGSWHSTPDRARYVLRHLLDCVECQDDLCALMDVLASEALPPGKHWTMVRVLFGQLLEAVIERRVRPQMDEYIDVCLAAGVDAANAAFPELAGHLSRCSRCREEVEHACGVLEQGRAADGAWEQPSSPPDPPDPAGDLPIVFSPDFTEVSGSWPLESRVGELVYASAAVGKERSRFLTTWYQVEARIRQYVVAARAHWNLPLDERDVWTDVTAIACTVNGDTAQIPGSRRALYARLTRQARHTVECHVIEDLLRDRASPYWNQLYVSMVQRTCMRLGYAAGQPADCSPGAPLRAPDVLPAVLVRVASEEVRETITSIADRAIVRLQQYLARNPRLGSLQGWCSRIVAHETNAYLRSKTRKDQRDDALRTVARRPKVAMWESGLLVAFSDLRNEVLCIGDDIEEAEECEERDVEVPSAWETPEDMVVARESAHDVLEDAISALVNYALNDSHGSEDVARRMSVLYLALIRDQHDAVIAEHLDVTRQQVQNMVSRFRRSPTARHLLESLEQAHPEAIRPNTRAAPAGRKKSQKRSRRR